MTLHAVFEYLKYRWKARGRHGTHSPFVYDLVERVLMDKDPIPREYVVELRELPLKYENLVSRIRAGYGLKGYAVLPGAECTEVVVIRGRDMAAARGILDNRTDANKVIIITCIHDSLAATTMWNRLCAHPSVVMSVDVYGLGIFFFRPEFKAKQHFVLQYS